MAGVTWVTQRVRAPVVCHTEPVEVQQGLPLRPSTGSG